MSSASAEQAFRTPELRTAVMRPGLAPALLFLLLGVGYVLLTPIFDAPDEPAHYLRAYGLAEGQWVLRDHPREVVAFMMDRMLAIEGAAEVPILRDIGLLLEQTDGERIDNIAFNTSHYAPVPYLFHALAIRLTLLWPGESVSFPVSVYICRLTTVCVSFLALCWFFTRIPELSWPIFVLATAPMALSQMSIVSPDFIVFCSAAVLLGVAFGPIRRWEQLLLAATLVFLAMTKPPYAILALVPLVAVVFLDPRPAWGLVLGIIAACIGALSWKLALEASGSLDFTMRVIQAYRSPDIDPAAQLRAVLADPVQFVHVLWNTLRWEGGHLYRQVVGSLGWLVHPVPYWSVAAWTGALLAAMVAAEPPAVFSVRQRLLLGGICMADALLAFILAMLALYMIWMPVNHPYIEAQGRYFHPLLGVFLIGVVLMRRSAVSARFRAVLVTFALLAVIMVNVNAYVILFNR